MTINLKFEITNSGAGRLAEDLHRDFFHGGNEKKGSAMDIKGIFAAAFISISTILAPVHAEDGDPDCTDCVYIASDEPCSTCGDSCAEKPQPPRYDAGEFDLEASDAYDQALSDYEDRCLKRD